MFNLMVKPIHYILTNKQVILKVILLLLALGGIFVATATYHDYINDVDITKSQDIQIFTKEAIKLEQGKTFLWIFSKSDLSVIDIQEIDNYEVTIDEETNGTSTFEVLKNTGAESGDIVCFKKDEDVLYWGIIDEITNENGGIKYTYQCKYITNIFNQKLPTPVGFQDINLNMMFNRNIVQLSFLRDTSFVFTPDENENIVLRPNTRDINQFWEIVWLNTSSPTYGYTCNIIHSATGKYLSSSNVGDSQLYLDTTPFQWNLNDEAMTDTHTQLYFVNDTFQPIEFTGEIADLTEVKLGLEDLSEDYYKLIINKDLTPIIQIEGVEDFIAEEMKRGWHGMLNQYNVVPNVKSFYPIVETHTPKQINIELDGGGYNLHTFMTNATQYYNINYWFEIGDNPAYEEGTNEPKIVLLIHIENVEGEKELVDVNAMNISDYQEVFDTDIVSQVICNTKTWTYHLYLKSDRTTTNNPLDPNRASGKTEVIYTDNFDEAPQECLNVIQKNQYNHNISFTYDKYIPVGTPIAIKTKNQAIENTYISSIKFSKNKFYQYECGNIRMNFIDKLLKERN